jgi:uncharacterized protein YjiS (DUF1127 family)
MPPQQTDAASESGAAALGLDLTIGLVKATDDALPEQNAVGLAAGPTRNVPGLLKRYWHAFREWQRRPSRTNLHDLNDRALMDIGVTREEIDYIAPQRAIDALRDSIHARGVM